MGWTMATKVMVSFPDEFLAEVDRVARQEHRSRSELVREALRLYIRLGQGQQVPGASVQVRQAVKAQDLLSRPAPSSGQGTVAGNRQMPEAEGGAARTLADQDQQAVREFQRRLAEIASIRNLRVFGSRARGDAAPGSDLDLFIELEEVTPEIRERISELAWEVGFELDRVISTVVASRGDLEEGAMGANPLLLNVEREGVAP
jgi:predicted nucleotidyltransferase/Arc/MetJ-type ribon-helix-helix transcriptional regulator